MRTRDIVKSHSHISLDQERFPLFVTLNGVRDILSTMDEA